VANIVGAERVFVFGTSRSELMAQTFAVRLAQVDLRVYFVGDMTTPTIGRKDLLILVSNAGKTMSVVKTAQIVERMDTKCVSVTSSRKSFLAKTSDSVVVINTDAPDTDELAPLGTLFEDTTLPFLDSLVPELMVRLDVIETQMPNNYAI